jgi:hypothetical protein
MEFMAQFNAKIVYVKGDQNTAADGLSRILVSECIDQMSEFADDIADCCCGAILPQRLLSPTSKTQVLETVAALAESEEEDPIFTAVVLDVTMDNELLQKIKSGYKEDSWCRKLTSAATGSTLVSE